MWRNKEFVYYSSALISVLLIGIFCAFYLHKMAGIFMIVISFIILILQFLFYKWRYVQIAKLSETLRRISSGDYDLDIRDYEEGELSLLKSEIYKVTLCLRESAELLEKEQAVLTDAISDISHQLKTPLTSMRIMNDLLSDSHLDSNRRDEFTLQIHHQLSRLEWLVSSLLKLSKLETKIVTFKKDPLLISDLIQEVVHPFQVALEVKEQSLELIGKDYELIADYHWTREALTNVFKNAIEHTGMGGKITILYADNPIYSEIIIRDTGSGIAREELPYLFKRFFRGKNAHPDSVGIGLAMAKRIMLSQDGDITVESEEGIGTSFHLKFYKLPH